MISTIVLATKSFHRWQQGHKWDCNWDLTSGTGKMRHRHFRQNLPADSTVDFANAGLISARLIPNLIFSE
jgi:hypothetical protein